jgi:hypothetical protein
VLNVESARHSLFVSYTLSNAEGFYLWGRVSSLADCSVIKPPASEQAICPSGTPSSRTPPGDYIWHAPQVHHMADDGPVTAATPPAPAREPRDDLASQYRTSRLIRRRE